MNREKAIRHKIYDVLNTGNISYDDGTIDVWDEKAEDTTNNIYILLKRQTAQAPQTFCQNQWDVTIEVWVVNKQPDTISKDTTDDIVEQIEDLLSSAMSGGVEYEGWQILNFNMDSLATDDYFLSDTKTEMQVTLIFNARMIKL